MFVAPSPREQLAHFKRLSGVGLELRLRKALDGIDAFDAVVVDCPGDLERLTQNALVAADVALAVTDLETFGLRGLADVLTTIEHVHEDYGGAALAGIVPNGFDARVRGQCDDLALLQRRFDGLVWEPLPSRALFGRAARARAGVHAYPAHQRRDVTAILDGYVARLHATAEGVPA